MKDLNQNEIASVSGGVTVSGLYQSFGTTGLSAGCQNAFRVETNSYSSHYFTNSQFKAALSKCTDHDAMVILHRLSGGYDEIVA